MTTDPKNLRTIAEVAKRSPLSEPAIRARIDRGEITAVKVGGRVFLDEAEVIAKLGPDLYSPKS